MEFTKVVELIKQTNALYHKLEYIQEHPNKASAILSSNAEQMQEHLEKELIRAAETLRKQPKLMDWAAVLHTSTEIVMGVITKKNSITGAEYAEVEKELKACSDGGAWELPQCLGDLFVAYVEERLMSQTNSLLGLEHNFKTELEEVYGIIYGDVGDLTLVFDSKDAMCSFAKEHPVSNVRYGKFTALDITLDIWSAAETLIDE